MSTAIARVKEGDISALHFLYVRYADDVCGFVQSIVRDSYEAEDITQNVFAKLPTAIRKYEQREVLVLRHIAGLSPCEIAELLDKSEGSIHGLHHRGRAALQSALRELGAAPVTAFA